MGALRAADADLLDKLLGKGVSNVFSRAFGLMDLTETVLEERGMSKAMRNERSLFIRMAPTPVFNDVDSEPLMRMHFEELCDRFESGESFVPGTVAEVIAGLHGASLQAPLNREAMAVLKTITAGTFLECCYADLAVAERWKGQVEETLAELRRTMRCEARA